MSQKSNHFKEKPTQMEVVILCHSAALDLLVCRLRGEGVDCTIAPPNAVKITIDIEGAEGLDFLPLTKGKMERVIAACMNVSHAAFTQDLFPMYHPAVATLPFKRMVSGDLFLHHGSPTQLLYGRLAGPETITSYCGTMQGGPWILFRAKKLEDGYKFLSLGIQDDALLATATGLMEEATSY